MNQVRIPEIEADTDVRCNGTDLELVRPTDDDTAEPTKRDGSLT